VALRDPRPDDAEALAQAFVDDPSLGATVGAETDPSLDQVRGWMVTESEHRASGLGMALVIAGEDDTAVGLINLHKIVPDHRRAEVGIWLAPGARGDGIGTEALRLITEWAMPALGLQRLQMTTMSDNGAMIGAAQHVGYVLEGVLRAYTFERGVPVDNAMLAVVR
jgi:RimJ/RimL family protein N-acetyltransferase